MRRHRPTRHRSYTIDAGDGGRDLRIFISSLIIGICIGAFGVYFWVERPHSRQLTMLQAELNTALNRANNCNAGHSTTLGQREELESRLTSCLANLNRSRQSVASTAAGEDAPPLPKTPPGRGEETSDLNTNPPTEAALALPVTTPAPALSPPAPVAEITPPTPPQAFTPPANWPPLPKTPSTNLRSTNTPEPTPSPTISEPVAAPVEPVPPVADTPAPVTEPTPPAQLVWPENFPPQPKVRPTPPPAPARSEAPQADPATTTATLVPLSGVEQITLNVGNEESIGSGRKLRLIAVSRRNSGRFCIVGGTGLESLRIASGGSATKDWGGQRVVFNASAQDGDTCRITVRPQ